MIVTSPILMFHMPGSGNSKQPDISWALARCKPSVDGRLTNMSFAKVSVGTSRKNEKRMFHLAWMHDEARFVHSRDYDVACNCTSPAFIAELESAIQTHIFTGPDTEAMAEELI